MDADFLRFVPLFRHGMAVEFGGDHPLAARTPLTVADLQAHPMVTISP